MVSKKDCRRIIGLKHLPVKIIRVGQMDRLAPVDGGYARPIVSWSKLYDELVAMPDNSPKPVEEPQGAVELEALTPAKRDEEVLKLMEKK